MNNRGSIVPEVSADHPSFRRDPVTLDLGSGLYGLYGLPGTKKCKPAIITLNHNWPLYKDMQ